MKHYAFLMLLWGMLWDPKIMSYCLLAREDIWQLSRGSLIWFYLCRICKCTRQSCNNYTMDSIYYVLQFIASINIIYNILKNPTLIPSLSCHINRLPYWVDLTIKHVVSWQCRSHSFVVDVSSIAFLIKAWWWIINLFCAFSFSCVYTFFGFHNTKW